MPRPLAGLLPALLTAAALTWSPTTPASAAPPADPMPPGLADAVARDLHRTPAAARARWAADARAGDLDRALAARLGPRYGGGWITPDGALAVGVTDPAAAAVVAAAGGDPRPVARSLSALRAATARLDATATPAAVADWYVDVAGNAVVLSATDPATARRFVRAAAVDPAAVRIVATAHRPQLLVGAAPTHPAAAEVIGGNAYRIGSARCSVGFPVQGGFATAGHCGKQGRSTTSPAGTIRGSTFPGADHAWVGITGSDQPVPAVNDHKGGRVPVRGSTPAAVGADICRSGSTSGWRCGTVTSLDATANYPQGKVPGLILTSACAERGDSGGSFLAGEQAQGVASGASPPDCKAATTKAFAQPINPLLEVYKLTLLTAPAPPRR
ncbi:hypothetical protein GCM10010123_04110 [Pilimelia anulata]|uniref:Serine protease n=1 Tax=Pilimelia anulata TaxID=53371 RepID=A0A8J3F643_9ACTN|nr:S1 family peptidase [Pilimelia anulata]GGJ77276.1 hypothetical protein GCM10010123_04110 [Pilimelia anulata]